jgi:anti-sigma B factor antagonist
METMDINVRTDTGVAIMSLSGKLVHGTGDVQLRDAFIGQIEGGQDKILIEMSGVKMVDSSGLGELIRCQATAKARDAEIKLLNVNLKTYKLLTMSRLIGVFDIFDDEAKAVASFDA